MWQFGENQTVIRCSVECNKLYPLHRRPTWLLQGWKPPHNFFFFLTLAIGIAWVLPLLQSWLCCAPHPASLLPHITPTCSILSKHLSHFLEATDFCHAPLHIHLFSTLIQLSTIFPLGVTRIGLWLNWGRYFSLSHLEPEWINMVSLPKSFAATWCS